MGLERSEGLEKPDQMAFIKIERLKVHDLIFPEMMQGRAHHARRLSVGWYFKIDRHAFGSIRRGGSPKWNEDLSFTVSSPGIGYKHRALCN
jgi:hypothetical protein